MDPRHKDTDDGGEDDCDQYVEVSTTLGRHLIYLGNIFEVVETTDGCALLLDSVGRSLATLEKYDNVRELFATYYEVVKPKPPKPPKPKVVPK